MKNTIDNNFTTSDFYAAAFLVAKGYRLLGIDKADSRRFHFIFTNETDRPQLVSAFFAGLVDAVLIYKIDRIARNMADHVAIRSLLSQYGVRIYSVTEPIGGDNSTSKLLENVMASFAQFDNDAKKEIRSDSRSFTKCFEVKSIQELSYIKVQRSKVFLSHSSPPNYLNGSSFIYALKAADSPIIQSALSIQTSLCESLPGACVVAGLPEAGHEVSSADAMPITTVPSVTRKASRKKCSRSSSWNFLPGLLQRKRKWVCSGA